MITIPQFGEWSKANGWPEIDLNAVRGLASSRQASFFFRGCSLGGVNVAATVRAQRGCQEYS
eukprot:247931-Pyramimonas_sp.AAC.1